VALPDWSFSIENEGDLFDGRSSVG
jgi:hypothetical protein